MRSRSNSGVRLDFYQRVVQKTILKYQNPVTGLLPATSDHPHGWVRDNTYSILAVWGLALAYRKTADLDEDRAKAYELEQSVVKLMRGLLSSMMSQVDKVERFKYSQSPRDALHAKYSVSHGRTCVGDYDWGHLQIDATSLFLLLLAEMTASGLQIVYSIDEVDFIQNLAFYIQCAYRTPDYGVWERGDKTNHGLPELNASSIGMAKAAMEALNELDLFGARGGPASVIHVMPDEAQQCQAILASMLPRESNSKETDAALLSIISYPAFAVDDPELIDLTRETVVEKLQGRFGFRRFLRDGYKTPKEDPHRLHYEPSELAVFEDIECEWPIFFAYMSLDGLFRGNNEQVEEYMDALEEIMIKREDGIKLMPELYSVPSDKVDQEKRQPKSQNRIQGGKMPQMWGQSMYVLAKLLQEGFLSPGELDPLNRRLVAEPKPDLVVQVVILAEDKSIQDKLAYYDLKVQTFSEVAPLQVYPARVLSHIFAHLGRSSKLGLTGRPSDVVGILATSKLYTLGDKTLAFMPQAVDQTHFYLPLDVSLLLDMFQAEVQFLGANWPNLGRPLILFPIRTTLLDYGRTLHPALVATIKKLQTGYINGTRVHLGHMAEFTNTSCITNLTFLTEKEDSPDATNLLKYIQNVAGSRSKSSRLLSGGGGSSSRASIRRKSSVRGIIRRTCSIQVDPGDMPDFSHLVSHGSTSPFYIGTPKGSSTDLYYMRQSSSDGPRSRVSSDAADYQDMRYMRQSNEGPRSRVSSDAADYKDFNIGSGSGSSPGSSIPTSPTPETSSIFNIGPGSGNQDVSPHHLKSLAETSESMMQAYHMEQFAGLDHEELLEQLRDADSLHEQADIIHYLFVTKGADWDTKMEGRPGCKVKDLLMELYDKAGQMKQWWLVRHTAGMLKKRVEDLAKAVTDILVRQKQLAVGLPPEPREKIITSPLPPDELAAIIQESCGEDSSTAMLTQEILVYLAMFIRTEPKLFNEMLRLRVGLIIQVMASELARTLKCSGEEASDQLLNLSPYEMKTLLHHILSGKEFGVSSDPDSGYESVGDLITGAEKKRATVDELNTLPLDGSAGLQLQDSMDTDRQGQWLRRRRLDGALNRVPVGFYTEIWNILGRCHGLSIEGNMLPRSLTSEMTPGEMKFALQVEMVLNRIPQPEYRQLMVEAMMVLCLVVQHDNGKTHWNEVIHINRMVHMAEETFINEQRKQGDTTLNEPMKGSAGICIDFYDTAPSGRFGTMSYLCKAAVKMLHFPVTHDGNLDCVVS